MEKSNHKPIFYEFGSKRTLLVILVVFWIGLVECNPQLRNICIKKILGVLGEMLPKFLKNLCFCFGHNLIITHLN